MSNTAGVANFKLILQTSNMGVWPQFSQISQQKCDPGIDQPYYRVFTIVLFQIRCFVQAGLWCLEHAVSSLQADADKFVVVIDLNDFSMTNVDTKWCGLFIFPYICCTGLGDLGQTDQHRSPLD